LKTIIENLKGDKPMATIKIDNLSVTGSEFFSDSESYLDQVTELSEIDALSIKGGTGRPWPWWTRLDEVYYA
jgi:hypothetical protein